MAVAAGNQQPSGKPRRKREKEGGGKVYKDTEHGRLEFLPSYV
jgi:hypothetical protein